MHVDISSGSLDDYVAHQSAVLTESGDIVLDDVYAFLGRFIRYPSEHAHVAHTLWVAHTHRMDAWESTPRMAFLSPEPGSGKSRALEVTELLVPRPVEAINVTPAYLFRKVNAAEGRPTILYDEVDTVFGPKAKDNEEIRGLINAGHRKHGVAGRCVVRGHTIDTEEIPAYCAVAMAGLGALPDTIITRSIVVRMRRRAQSETIEPYRRRVHAMEGNRLRDRLSAWMAATWPTAIVDHWPPMPDGIEDRDADVWEALFAIAHAAGGEWPKRAREAAVALVADSKQNTPSLGIKLLEDLRQIFGESDALPTEKILTALHALDESPWGDLYNKPLSARDLGRYLRPYEVKSKNIRFDGSDPVKGYRRQDLQDPWLRYLDPPMQPEKSATSATSATDATVVAGVAGVADVAPTGDDDERREYVI